MKPADKVFLDGLRKSVCDHISQEHWDLVVKAVNDAGDIRDVTGYARTIILEGVEKGRFASRSEAGRYAANMRWRGSVPQGGLATAEARQEANAKAGLGAGNPARGSAQSTKDSLGQNKAERKATEEVDEKTASAIKDADLSDLSSMIRRDLRSQGKKIPFGAEPYLDALSSLSDANESYGMDSGKSMIAYALSNLTSYKGPKARAIKAELKARMKAAKETPYSERNLDNVDFSKATFSSRSEAGRYAANMRWKGQGKTTTPAGDDGKYQNTGISGRQIDIRRMKSDDKQYLNELSGVARGEWIDEVLDGYPDQEKRGTGKTSTGSTGANSEEAQIKQAFIDAQKERLGNMGRGTSQGSFMALEAGIKKLEAELASGDTSEARNKPGQFFDDRPGVKGPKYIGRRPVKEVSMDIRRDLKDAVANGELPSGLKFSVKTDNRGTSAVRVRVSGAPKTRDDYGRLTGEAKAVYEKVDSIVRAYGRDNSDTMSDYFDTDYYGFTDLDD